jgi:hypothetical protein
MGRPKELEVLGLQLNRATARSGSTPATALAATTQHDGPHTLAACIRVRPRVRKAS